MNIRVSTTGRLHLGFMDLNGSLGRLYGSIGVALSDPVTEIIIRPQGHLSVENVDHEKKRRILNIIQAFAKYFKIEVKVRLTVVRSIPEHKGLGSGTQLALAVTTALAQMYGLKIDPDHLAPLACRGGRSSIGINSFKHGGLIIDSGKKILKNGSTESSPPKTMFRWDFPEDWRFVVVIPEEKEGLSGEQEKMAVSFVHPSSRLSEEICRVVMMRLLPSFMDRDIEGFGQALSEIDRKTGLCFAPVQGGIYSEKLSEKIIDHLLEAGAYGAGQSSWGPAVYGLALHGQAAEIAREMRNFLENDQVKGNVLVCSGRNRGAEISLLEPNSTTIRRTLEANRFHPSSTAC